MSSMMYNWIELEDGALSKNDTLLRNKLPFQNIIYCLFNCVNNLPSNKTHHKIKRKVLELLRGEFVYMNHCTCQICWKLSIITTPLENSRSCQDRKPWMSCLKIGLQSVLIFVWQKLLIYHQNKWFFILIWTNSMHRTNWKHVVVPTCLAPLMSTEGLSPII